MPFHTVICDSRTYARPNCTDSRVKDAPERNGTCTRAYQCGRGIITFFKTKCEILRGMSVFNKL